MLSAKTLTDSKHMFYNVGNRYWNDVSDIGGIYVDEKKTIETYQDEVIKLIKKVKNPKWLTYIYAYVKKFIE